MKIIPRFIQEFFDGSLKCQRLGHKMTEKRLTIRKRAGLKNWNAVVVDYAATQKLCLRCGHKEPVVIGEEVNWFSSCSMPREMWKEIDRNGYVIID